MVLPWRALRAHLNAVDQIVEEAPKSVASIPMIRALPAWPKFCEFVNMVAL